MEGFPVRNKTIKNKMKVAYQLESRCIRFSLIGFTIIFITIFLVLPVVFVFQQALSKGAIAYFNSLREPDTLSAIKISLITMLSAVIINTVFGISAAYAVTRFRFPGKNLLVSLFDIPLMISPVVSGLMFILLFGLQGWFGSVLSIFDIEIIFALPGVIIVTCFVTLPYVVRELIPVMQALGSETEEAAMVLGARNFKMLLRVTIPSIKWGLLYGITLCSARALGEFGGVSVVSGHISGATNTIPLQVEILHNEYNFTASFSVASVLMILALVSLIIRTVIYKKCEEE